MNLPTDREIEAYPNQPSPGHRGADYGPYDYGAPGPGAGEWDEFAGGPGPGPGWQPGGFDASGWLESLRNLWQWDQLAAEIGQESQARVALVGQGGVGKDLLFNRLRGWSPAEAVAEAPVESWARADEHSLVLVEQHIQSYGCFVLIDLPPHPPELAAQGDEMVYALNQATLVVYLLDGTQGLKAADYRWIATIRAAGRPLLLALNKSDRVESVAAAVADTERRIGMSVIPISARTGMNVEARLLPAMLDAVPRLAVPLGREIVCLRRVASRRVIRQAALISGMMGAQPVPMLDIPFQAIVQVGVVMRVGAAYGYVPTGGISREVIGTVVSTFGLRYLALALVKMVPVLGWVLSGTMSGAMTLLIGEAAIRYYEAGGSLPLNHWLKKDEVS
jgi:uncharacterized protein (DUF697 family)/GTPase SAR1 family protein